MIFFKGTYVKLKPIGQNNFLNISNPKAVYNESIFFFLIFIKHKKD